MTDDFRSYDVLAAALLRAALGAADEALEKGQKRLERLGLYTSLQSAADGLQGALTGLLDSCADPDKRIGIERRMSTYKIGLYHVKPACHDLHVVSLSDLELLVSARLQECELDCPCTIEEDAAVRSEAVRGCEVRKLYKRLLLEGGVGGECPYELYAGK